jgi:hypothetical protein
MMRNILLSQLACVMFTVLIYFPCHAQDISSAELIKDAKQYDGKSVTYRGEVVGDIMIRGEHSWLSVNDGPNAIGVWINKELIKNIQYIGDYRTKGDMVEIVGIFKRSCPEHGGDLDIHAQSINKIGSGSKISHAVNTRAIKFAFGLFCMALLVFLLKVWRSRRSVLE